MMLAVSFAFMFLAIFGQSMAAEVAAAQAQKASADVANGNNLLGFSVYKELAKKPGNICFSPLSAEIILALTLQGAQGPTASEMSTALKLPSDAAVSALGFKTISQQLKSATNGVIFKTANKIYPANGINIKPSFKQVAVDSFSADVENLDFAKAAESAGVINKWVEGQTNDKIKNLISADDLTPDTRMVLINAVYFMATWKYTFEVTPFPLKFYSTETEFKEVPAIATEHTFGYAENEELDAQILELPYNDSDYSLLILLPRKINGLAKLESQFPLNLKEIVSSLQYVNVAVTMPKFKIEQTIPMNDILKTLGMTTAFSDQANFSGISDEPLKISKVLQKTFIEVDEKGTEAAAATAGIMELRTARVFEPQSVIVNRPFVYVLFKKSTYTVTFIGAVKKL